MRSEEEIVISFGKILKDLRERRGLTQENLAHNINSHFTHISRLENGHKQPTLTILFKLARELKVEPEYFIKEIKNYSS